VLGNGWRYAQRLGRWAVILRQVRGSSWRDELKLLASAGAAPILSLRRLSKWQDPVLLFDASVEVPRIGRFRVRRRTDDLWHILPWRERAIHAALERLLRPGDVFVDAGANIGVYTLLASRLVGQTGRVVAIEMMPDTAELLRRHVAENGCANVEIVERALNGRAGETVTARVPTGQHGQASVANMAEANRAYEERIVRTTTLDDVTRGLQRIDILKLDVEGAELMALAGGATTLQKTQKVIYESHTEADALARALADAGFTVTSIMGKDRLAERQTSPSARPA
jgi:FkbM family methyltransferase